MQHLEVKESWVSVKDAGFSRERHLPFCILFIKSYMKMKELGPSPSLAPSWVHH